MSVPIEALFTAALGLVAPWEVAQVYTAYMDVQHAINLALLRQLNERDIVFALPTQTVHLQTARPVVVRMEPPQAKA